MKGEFVFSVRSYECGADGHATLATVCNYLQESASLNAEARGFSKSNFDADGENISWVLTRLLVRMDRYPAWNEKVTIVTWPRGGRKIVAWRDFEIRDENGGLLGVATSEWMLIDLASRKIVPVPERVFTSADEADGAVLGEMPFSRFRFPAGGESAQPLAFKAQRAHIDLNGHVNNVHYVEWMLEPCTSSAPSEVEIVFRSETLAGDEVRVQVAQEDGWTYHRVYAPGGTDHVVARTR